MPFFDTAYVGNNVSHPTAYVALPQLAGQSVDTVITAYGDSMQPVINNGDMVALKRVNDIAGGVLYGELYAVETDSGYCISRKRVKSGEIYKIMLLKPSLALMSKYDFELPKVVFTTYNHYLRTLGELVGLDFRLTSHVGRHTFATWVLSQGVPIEIVAKMLGHTDINTTQIYAKVLAEDVNNAFRKLDEKL